MSRLRPGHDLREPCHPARDPRHERAHLVGDGYGLEQTAVVLPPRVDELSVDDGDVEDVQGHARAFDHPGLHGHVGEVVLLEPRCRLHLRHAHASSPALEDIGTHEHALVTERALEERHVAGPREGLLRRLHRTVEVVLPLDEDATGVQRARHVVDVVPDGEAPPRLGRIDGERRTVHLQPEALAALETVGDA